MSRLTTDQKVGGSSPSERASEDPGHSPDAPSSASPLWLIWPDSGRTGLVGVPETVRVAVHVVRVEVAVQVPRMLVPS
jgi:hypothetical protein